MHYHNTQTFRNHTQSTITNLIQYKQQYDELLRQLTNKQLKNVELKKYKQLPTRRLEAQLKIIQNKIASLSAKKNAYTSDMSQFNLSELRNMLVETEEHVWNSVQVQLGKKDREDYEGKFEDSYRDYMGWPLGASQGCTDFPDMTEGKYLSNTESSFRLGKVGKRAYGSLLRTIARKFDESIMTLEQWEALFDGEVSAGKLYHSFPHDVRILMQDHLAPAKVLDAYNAMVFFTDTGFFKVPRVDYVAAFSISYVSQMGPKYKLKREYIEQRIRSASERSKTTRIGLIPMSAKPYHAGHHGLVLLASKENDEVHLYVSLNNRDIISGQAMATIWREQIESILPDNVFVTYVIGKSPVKSVYDELAGANINKSHDIYNVYSDNIDVKNFDTLGKYAGEMLERNQIKMRPVERTSTVNISGTQMRAWILLRNKEKFVANLPNNVDGDMIWNTLLSSIDNDKLSKNLMQKVSSRDEFPLVAL